MAEQVNPIEIVVTDRDEAARTESELAKEARMLDYICARLDECIAYRDSELEPRLENLWDIYEAEPALAQKNTPWENASNLSIALSATYVDQFVAKHVNALRSPVPFLSLSSYHPDNADAVRALSD